MSVTVETTKLVVEHLQSIFPNAESRRSYLSTLEAKTDLGSMWEKIGKQGIQKLVEQLDGQFGSSGSLPESAG